ncbi:hypothetical protein BVY02_02185 [bacterium J17]|nr:hypothetical protein BVY02_02185 [bacterium J17]
MKSNLSDNYKAFGRGELPWLLKLRWLVAACLVFIPETFAIFGFGTLERQYFYFAALITACSNVALTLKDKLPLKTERLVGSALVIDIICLALLLHNSGGPHNPFSSLLLVHITLGAVLLSQYWIWLLVSVATLSYASLFAIEALSGRFPIDDAFALHLFGMLFSFVMAACFIAYFVGKLIAEVQEKEKQVAELQVRKFNEERLASLTSLAAGAAHELGTPLSTISISSDELRSILEEDISKVDEVKENVKLIQQEIKRCKSIVQGMAGEGKKLIAEKPEQIISEEFFDILNRALNESGKDAPRVHMRTEVEKFTAPREGLLESTLALLSNSLDASREGEAVRLKIYDEATKVNFVVEDQGHGVSEENIERIREPFFSTKEPGSGMGLGLFLVDLFAKRWNGSLQIFSDAKKGTKAVLSLPKLLPHKRPN